jgi:putative transcriptional regulator
LISPTDKQNYEDTINKYIGRLKDGCILLSNENLNDPNFKVTVVLICVYNNEGAFGLVCNRPSHMPLSEIFDRELIQKAKKRSIYIGGPVQQDNLVIIQITDSAAEHAYKVAPRVYLGGEWESVGDILSEETATTRLFLGYSGWAPGQLEMEVVEGAWEVYHVDVEKFLLNWEEPLYNDIGKIRQYLLEQSVIA